jgi:hypothetical protein
LWRTQAVTFEGVLFSMAGVVCEAYRQTVVEEERDAESAEGDKNEEDQIAKAVRLLKASSLVRSLALLSISCPSFELILFSLQRSLLILPVLYLLAIAIGLQDPHGYNHPLRIEGLILYPVVASIATSSLIFSISTSTFDLFSSIFAYNASNALRLATLYLTSTHFASMIRLPLLVNCLANAVLYAVMLRSPNSPSSKVDLPAYSSLSGASTPFLSRHSHRLIAAVPVLMPLIWVLRLLATHHTVDLVVAHYSIPLPDLRHFISQIQEAPLVRSSRTRVIIYEKGDFTDEQLYDGLRGVARPGRNLQVVHLPNYGREGATYLEHITAHYNDTLPLMSTNRFSAAAADLKHQSTRLFRKRQPMADHTLFLQSHLAWEWIAEGRLKWTLRENSGFVSFGPYLTNLCGADGNETGFYPGVQRAFEGVFGYKCTEGKEEDRVLSSWAAQFAASRERVMANPYELWDELRRTIEVRSCFPTFPALPSLRPSSPSPTIVFSSPLLLPSTTVLIFCPSTTGAERRSDPPTVEPSRSVNTRVRSLFPLFSYF